MGLGEDRSSSLQQIDDQVPDQGCDRVQESRTQVQSEDQVVAQPKPPQAQPHTSIPLVDNDNYVQGHNVRPVRARQAPDRLVVGNPLDPRFNRTSGR